MHQLRYPRPTGYRYIQPSIRENPGGRDEGGTETIYNTECLLNFKLKKKNCYKLSQFTTELPNMRVFHWS